MSTYSLEALIAFVENAYQSIQEQGRDSTRAEFQDPGAWSVGGEFSLFACDLMGTPLPGLMGKNQGDATGASDARIIEDIIRTARSGGGFVRSFSLDPVNGVATPWINYVMMAGRDAVIGSGIPWANDEDPYIRVGGDPVVRANLRYFVGEAIAYARAHGKPAALREFNDQEGTFVRGNLYIYAYDYEGTTLALPFQPHLVGTNLSHLKDAFGVKTNRIQCFLAEQGGGFIFLHYHNPARDMAMEPKMSYVSPVDDSWWVGAGIYLNG